MINIALDIDGVLKEFGDYFLEYLKFEDKTPPKHWDDPRYRNHFSKIADDIQFWATVPDIFDPKLMVFTPHCYITARPCPSWVSEQSLFENSNFPKAKVITVGMNKSKSKAVLKEGVDLMLDDAIHNFEDLNGNGINCLLVTRSHNEDYPEPHVRDGGRRVDSLLDFQELFFTDGISDNSGSVFNTVLYSNIFANNYEQV